MKIYINGTMYDPEKDSVVLIFKNAHSLMSFRNLVPQPTFNNNNSDTPIGCVLPNDKMNSHERRSVLAETFVKYINGEKPSKEFKAPKKYLPKGKYWLTLENEEGQEHDFEATFDRDAWHKDNETPLTATVDLNKIPLKDIMGYLTRCPIYRDIEDSFMVVIILKSYKDNEFVFRVKEVGPYLIKSTIKIIDEKPIPLAQLFEQQAANSIKADGFQHSPIYGELVVDDGNLIVSAFQFDNGMRIKVTTMMGGIKTFICDEDWKQIKLYAESTTCHKTPLQYHKTIRALHKPEHLVKEQSTQLP